MAVLVKFRKDWADEFDVYGFRVFESLEAWNTTLEKVTGSSYQFGTNEGWEGGDDESESIQPDDFTVDEIDDQEVAFLEKHFKRSYGTGIEWGHFPS